MAKSLRERLKEWSNNDFINSIWHLTQLFLDWYYLEWKDNKPIKESEIILISKKTNG